MLRLKSKHRIMCGDSTSEDDVSRLMGGEKADMVFTDPPYNVNKKILNDSLSHDDFQKFISKAISNAKISLIKNGSLFLWCCESELFNIHPHILKDGYFIRRLLLWVYTKGIALNNNYSKQSEFLFYAVKSHDDLIFNSGEIRVPSQRMLSGDKRAGKDGKVPPNWFDDGRISGNFKERTDHPTQKPISICERFVKAHANDLVLDLFLGSGSTLIACEKTNRRCYGMEIDEHYMSVILKRYEDYTNETAVRL